MKDAALRGFIAAIGVAAMAWAAWLLRDQDVVGIGTWAVAGIVVHDAVLAPLTFGIGWVATRRLHGAWAAAAVAGLVVVATVTVMAVPVLGGFGLGQDPANHTYLDRDYVLGWCIVAALTMLGALIAGVVMARRRVRV